MSFPRYPKYKDSGVEWLGEVPEHWQAVRLKRLATIHNGRDYKEVETDFEGYPVIGSGGEFARASDYLYNGESVLLGRKGTIDRPLYVNGPFWTADTMFYTVIGNKVFARYLYYCALTIRFDLYSTNTALPSMTQSVLGDISFALPGVTEQREIARFLDRETHEVDVLVEEQRRLIELLTEKRQAVISHAVTKGLNPNAPMKDSGVKWLGDVPDHWQVLRLRQVCAFLTSGPRGWSDRISESGTIFVQSGDLDDALSIRFDDCKRVQVEEGAEGSRTLLANGDIVVCITGAKTGNVAVCGGLLEPAHINQHLCLVRAKGAILSRFLGAILKSDVGQTYFALSQYGLKLGLSLENVKQAPLPLPPLSEQELILRFLDSQETVFRSLANDAALAIGLLLERRTAVISAAVTGKIDVRGLVREDAA